MPYIEIKRPNAFPYFLNSQRNKGISQEFTLREQTFSENCVAREKTGLGEKKGLPFTTFLPFQKAMRVQFSVFTPLRKTKAKQGIPFQ